MANASIAGGTNVTGTNLHYADIIVIVLYFVIVLAIGIWSSCRNRGSVGGYFLAGRSMHWIPVGASLFASNIGSGHFIGLAGSGAASGIGIAVFELNAIFVLMILGWVFVPVYVAAGVYTMPEYLRKRFGGQRIRVYLAVLALLLYIFTKISADLYAGAVFIEQSLKWNLYASVLLLLGIAALFTITGGLTAVIWTDFIQTIIMVIGAFVLMILSFTKVGGYQAVKDGYFEAIPETTLYSNATCGIPASYSYNLMRGMETDLPWTGAIFGLMVSAIWYWCSDQVIVQRALAAKDLSHAKGGTILAGYLKILPLWLLVFPGMIARILFPDEVGCADPAICKALCGKERGCTDIAYPKLVLNLMPDGARGLMLAVMMAALMSSLTSIFNSGSTIFTMDIWRRIRKHASDMELMIVGRVFVLVLAGIGIAWIPIVQSGAELFHYIQAVTSYLSPPVCAVYVLAIFWKRTNEQGAFWGLMVGLVTGLIRFGWEYAYPPYPCGQEYLDTKPSIISSVHYLHFGCILFVISLITTIVISLFTKPIDDKYLIRLTYWSRYDKGERVDIDEEEKEGAKVAAMELEGRDNEGMSKSSSAEAVVDQPGDSVVNSQAQLAGEGEPDKSKCRKAGEWICGIENLKEEEISPEDLKILTDKAMSIDEKPKWRRLCNINAVILMCLAIFVWAFFA
ncbi:sodium/glucose cotransporter 4-like [Lineus longissimus]|uniref:sodium/glucose cotransporter 4-like n=1 Tax=Lineus longissimus TaxID=88925 RepID=UPI002B4ED690